MTEDNTPIAIDIPGNRCFGCGPVNPVGLKLVFYPDGPQGVFTHFVAEPDHCGAEGVVHGGLQAVLLDEVMGTAIRAAHQGGEQPQAVTAEFNLKYRRPAPVGDSLRVEGRLLRAEGRNLFLEGRLLDEAGELLSSAEARWVVIGTR